MSEIIIPTAFKGLFQKSRYKAYYGGRGSAKSHSFAAALLVKGCEKSIRVLCGREIQKSIKDSVKKLLDDKIRQYKLDDFYTSTDTEIRGKNGTSFIFSGLKSNPESIKSMEAIDICWLEEANTVSQRSLDLLIPTIRVEGSEIWFSWNPEEASDPVDLMFRGPTPPANAIIKQVSWRDNPYFSSVLKEEMERDKVNPLKYEHVWEGGYDLTTETKVLRRIKENATAVTTEAMTGENYVMGVDLGRHMDFTVIIVFDEATHKMVYIDRFNQIDWALQKARIEAVARRYNDALIRIDATGVGDPITEDLKRAGLRVEPFVFTNNTKKSLVDNLALKLEQDDIKIIQHPELIQEMTVFKYEKTASGNIRYSAPDGLHDDCVMSLGLAVYNLPPKNIKVFKDLLTDDDVQMRYNAYGEPIYY
jgi:PBSX family phage terminase large subunit